MKNIWKTGTALSVMLLATPAFAAADNAEVMKQLKAMQEQINSLQGQVQNLKGELSEARAKAAKAEKTADKVAAKISPAAGPETKVTLGPGIQVATSDGEYSMRVGGFAQVDAGMFNDDIRDHPDGTTLRRARLNASGVIAKDWKYKLENDFTNNASALTDVYLEYASADIKPFSIMIGQFKEPFSLETLTSDLFTTFVERASPTVFSPDRRIGIAVSANDESSIGFWTGSFGVFGAGTGTASNDDESRDFTGRITLAPWAGKTQVLHFGVAGSHRIPDQAGDNFRFQSRAENNLASSTAVSGRSLTVDTTSMSSVDDVQQYGLEFAGVYGPASIQAEYIKADVDRYGSAADVQFSGWYAEASYFLTGESKNYNAATAKFDRVKPMWNLDPKNGNWGAWQVAARMSHLDLTDGPITGGNMDNITLALKWIPHPNVMMTLNYITSDSDRNGVVANDDPDIILLRTQFDF